MLSWKSVDLVVGRTDQPRRVRLVDGGVEVLEGRLDPTERIRQRRDGSKIDAPALDLQRLGVDVVEGVGRSPAPLAPVALMSTAAS